MTIQEAGSKARKVARRGDRAHILEKDGDYIVKTGRNGKRGYKLIQTVSHKPILGTHTLTYKGVNYG